jgi:hypothetical protein
VSIGTCVRNFGVKTSWIFITWKIVIELEVKGKTVPALNYAPRHEDVGGSGSIASAIRNLE